MISTLKIQIVTIANVRVSCAFVLQCGIGRSPLGSSHSSLRTSRALCANICPLSDDLQDTSALHRAQTPYTKPRISKTWPTVISHPWSWDWSSSRAKVSQSFNCAGKFTT